MAGMSNNLQDLESQTTNSMEKLTLMSDRFPIELRLQIYEELCISPTGYVTPVVLRNSADNPGLPSVALESCHPYPWSSHTEWWSVNLQLQNIPQGVPHIYTDGDFAVFRTCKRAYEEGRKIVQQFYDGTTLLLDLNDKYIGLANGNAAWRNEARHRRLWNNYLHISPYQIPTEEQVYFTTSMKYLYKNFKKIEVFLFESHEHDYDLRVYETPRIAEDDSATLARDSYPNKFNSERDIIASIINIEGSRLEEIRFVLNLRRVYELFHELFVDDGHEFYHHLECRDIFSARFFCLMMGYSFTAMEPGERGRLEEMDESERQAEVAERGLITQRGVQSMDEFYSPSHRLERLPDSIAHPRLHRSNTPDHRVDFRRSDGAPIRRTIDFKTFEHQSRGPEIVRYEFEQKWIEPWSGTSLTIEDALVLAFLHAKFGFDVFFNGKLIWKDGVHSKDSPFQGRELRDTVVTRYNKETMETKTDYYNEYYKLWNKEHYDIGAELEQPVVKPASQSEL